MDNDSSIVKAFLEDVIEKYSKAKLIDIEIVKENTAEALNDVNIDPFTVLPLNRIPRNSKLKISFKIREPTTGREIECVAPTYSNENGTLIHPRKVEAPKIDTLQKETGEDKKVDPNTIERIVRMARTIAQMIISLLNFLITSGLIKIKQD